MRLKHLGKKILQNQSIFFIEESLIIDKVSFILSSSSIFFKKRTLTHPFYFSVGVYWAGGLAVIQVPQYHRNCCFYSSL